MTTTFRIRCLTARTKAIWYVDKDFKDITKNVDKAAIFGDDEDSANRAQGFFNLSGVDGIDFVRCDIV